MRDKAGIKEKTQQLVEMTSGFCDEYIDEEYKQLCEKLIRKMARKRQVPFLSGRMEIWAAVVIHVIGKVNFLYDKSFEPYVPVEDFCSYFGVSRSTVNQKSKRIRETMKIGIFDDEFSTGRTAEMNPFNEFVVVDGLIMPIDYVMSHLIEEQSNDDTSQETGFVVKVSLSDYLGRTRGKPYRIIGIHGDSTLDVLANAIVVCFDFDFDHSFGFYDNIKNWTRSGERYESFAGDTGEFDGSGGGRVKNIGKVSVGEVFHEPGKKMLFLYDYGDEWHFVVEFLQVRAIDKDEDTEFPVLLESLGRAPSQYGDDEVEFDEILYDEGQDPSQTSLDSFG